MISLFILLCIAVLMTVVTQDMYFSLARFKDPRELVYDNYTA